MMPVPPVVSELYPPPPGVVRERPWWRFDGQDLRRSDGRVLYDGKVTELAEYDRLHPLPHPGFRAGQVWIFEPATGCLLVVAVVGDTVVDADRVLHALVNGKESVIHNRRPSKQLDRAILLADPCCPWLAPWSPVAVTDG